MALKAVLALNGLGSPPTSTDPGVATIFATHSGQYGESAVQIALPEDVAGIARYEGYIASECEVGLGLEPSEFARRASIGIPANTARSILQDMGISIPRCIGIGDLSPLPANTQNLSAERIKHFVTEAGKHV